MECKIQLKACRTGKQSMICKAHLQTADCMNQYHLRTAEQLSLLLPAFRKEAGLRQSEVALRLGVTQQTYSTLERNAERVGVARLLKLLGILGVELVLSKPTGVAEPTAPPRPELADKPAW